MNKWIKIAFLIIGITLFALQNNVIDEIFNLEPTQKDYDIAGIFDDTTLYYVSKVIDGDTIVVETEGEEYKVRMIGIDTPETVHPHKPVECFGKEAKEKLEDLIFEKYIRLLGDETQDNIDTYGRSLRYVYLDDIDINLVMIKEGYAFEYTHITPYVKQEEYKNAQEYAKRNSLGLWDDNVCEYE